MSRDGRERRIGNRYLPRIIFAVTVVFIIILIGIVWNIRASLPSERTTIVIASDPIRVISWDEARRKLLIIPIPSDVRIDGMFGVGSLPIASLRKLESLDIKKKGVFAASIADSLAVPLSGVIDAYDTTESEHDDRLVVKNALSPFAWSGWWGSGLTLPLRIRLWWILIGLRPDAVLTFDLASRGVFQNTSLPDGSQVHTFDTNRFDAVIENLLELDAVRREELRIRVVNTTDVQGLGNRAARIVSHAGMVVVAVESEQIMQERCSIHAKKDRWESQTNRFVQRIFHCRMTDEDTDERVDLMIRLGTEYARKYTIGY